MCRAQKEVKMKQIKTNLYEINVNVLERFTIYAKVPIEYKDTGALKTLIENAVEDGKLEIGNEGWSDGDIYSINVSKVDDEIFDDDEDTNVLLVPSCSPEEIPEEISYQDLCNIKMNVKLID